MTNEHTIPEKFMERIDIDFISGHRLIEDLGQCELLCQLAEEASELAHAALKLRRAIDGTNPTPKSKEECEEELIEEIADVNLSIIAFVSTCYSEDAIDKLYSKIELIERKKDERWAERLREARREKFRQALRSTNRST